jgi:hypothetical protein
MLCFMELFWAFNSVMKLSCMELSTHPVSLSNWSTTYTACLCTQDCFEINKPKIARPQKKKKFKSQRDIILIFLSSGELEEGLREKKTKQTCGNYVN